MKIKTSISVSDYLLEEMGKFISPSKRSSFIEEAIKFYLGKLNKSKRNKKDVKIIKTNSKDLNQEAMDVLDYQVKM